MIELSNWVSELIKGLGYSALGFLVGYQFCKMRRSVQRIEEAVVKGEREGDDDDVVVTRKGNGEPSDWQMRVFGIVLLLMSVFTVGQSIYFQQGRNADTDRQGRITACQAEYNRDFARAVTVRGQYADEDRNELFKMISTVMSEPDAAKRRQAITDWIEVTKKNDELRKQNPLPNLAERNCEEK